MSEVAVAATAFASPLLQSSGRILLKLCEQSVMSVDVNHLWKEPEVSLGDYVDAYMCACTRLTSKSSETSVSSDM